VVNPEPLKETIQKYVQRKAGQECDLILGMGFEENLNDELSITLIATGFKEADTDMAYKTELNPDRTILELDDESQENVNLETDDDSGATNDLDTEELIEDELNEEDAILQEMEGRRTLFCTTSWSHCVRGETCSNYRIGFRHFCTRN